MKNMFIVLALAALLPGPALAEFGIKGGGGVSGADYSPMPANSSKEIVPGYLFGAYANWRLSGKLYLQPEALYVSKGFRLKQTSGGSSINAKYTLSCVELPLLLGFVPGGREGRLSFFAGPSLTLLTGAKVYVEISGGLFAGFSGTADVKEAFNKTTLSAVGGIRYDLSKDFLSELRIARGAEDISAVSAAKIRTTDVSLLLGIRF